MAQSRKTALDDIDIFVEAIQDHHAQHHVSPEVLKMLVGGEG